MDIKYDYSLMLKGAIGSKGLSEDKLKKIQPHLRDVHKTSHILLDTGEQGFIQTLFDQKETKLILDHANKIKKKFKQMLVIGIGGSDLGARALQSIFQDKTKGVEILFLGDTTDPLEIKRICSRINWSQCAINPVSKSGNTVEPLSTFLYVRQQLIKHVGKKYHAKHVFVTTQDQDSALKKLVDKNGYTLIPHPKNIGGRWTAMTLVGLLSAAVSGIDIKALRNGAKDYYAKAAKKSMNGAMVYASLHYLGIKQEQSLAVLMPYASHLEEFGGWYRQLFAESLGKAKNRKGKKVYTGVTPIAANGPKDQHSQVQLYSSGPFDKLITFIHIEEDKANLSVPRLKNTDNLPSFLSEIKFQDILQYEQEATALALASHKRASGVIRLSDSSEYVIGQLFCFFELACVYLAEILDINAFDQPGVEEGKNNMYALLGKPGYEKNKQKMKKQKASYKKQIA